MKGFGNIGQKKETKGLVTCELPDDLRVSWRDTPKKRFDSNLFMKSIIRVSTRSQLISMEISRID